MPVAPPRLRLVQARASLEAARAAALPQVTAIDLQRRALGVVQSRRELGASLVGNERQAAQLHGQRLAASVFLVKALGGGWRGESAPAAAAAPSAALR